MSRRLTTVLLATLLPLSAAACAPARAGISDLGYASYRDGAAFRGTTVDLLQEIQRRTGCPISLEWFPRGRLYAQYFSGQLEITGSSVRTPERDRQGVWLPYTYTHFELVLVNSKTRKFNTLAEFVDGSTARLNVTRGIAYSPATQAQLDRLQKLGRLEYVNDYGVVFRKILAGRAEGTVAPPAIHVLYRRQLNMMDSMTGMRIVESPRALIGIYVSKTVPPQVLHSYAEATRAIVADGTMKKIYERYLGEEITRQLYPADVREVLDAIPR
jgi:polar amino acid transport system substrate-binding protein